MAWCTVSCLVTDVEGTPIEGATIIVRPEKANMVVAGQVIAKVDVEVATDEYGVAEFDIPQQDSILSTDKKFLLTIRDANATENIFNASVYSPNAATATLDELITQGEEVHT